MIVLLERKIFCCVLLFAFILFVFLFGGGSWKGVDEIDPDGEDDWKLSLWEHIQNLNIPDVRFILLLVLLSFLFLCDMQDWTSAVHEKLSLLSICSLFDTICLLLSSFYCFLG